MNKNRPKTMLIRLSEEEYRQVKREIESSGMSQQEYLLHKVISPKNDGDITQKKEVVTPKNKCPYCGSDLILINGRRGKFWGCSSFPNCQFSKDWRV